MKHKKILIIIAFVAAVVALVAIVLVAYPSCTNKTLTHPPRTVNVKSYGAFGDGVHDDGPAILKAAKAAYGGTIFFPLGTYAVQPTFKMPTTVTKKGDGAGTNNQSWLKKTTKNADGTYSWRFIWIKP
jgi:hypothetical protein